MQLYHYISDISPKHAFYFIMYTSFQRSELQTAFPCLHFAKYVFFFIQRFYISTYEQHVIRFLFFSCNIWQLNFKNFWYNLDFNLPSYFYVLIVFVLLLVLSRQNSDGPQDSHSLTYVPYIIPSSLVWGRLVNMMRYHSMMRSVSSWFWVSQKRNCLAWTLPQLDKI